MPRITIPIILDINVEEQKIPILDLAGEPMDFSKLIFRSTEYGFGAVIDNATFKSVSQSEEQAIEVFQNWIYKCISNNSRA